MESLTSIESITCRSTTAKFSLEFEELQGGFAALKNIDVHGAVWRWVRAFHAAPYGAPLKVGFQGELHTPFPSGQSKEDGVVLEGANANYPQLAYVLEKNRAAQSVDRIVSNKGAVSYECVWGQPQPDGPWLCAFALNISDWKDLGEPRLYQRDCLGFYVQPDKPPMATREIGS
jgi:hypothetical protein